MMKTSILIISTLVVIGSVSSRSSKEVLQKTKNTEFEKVWLRRDICATLICEVRFHVYGRSQPDLKNC